MGTVLERLRVIYLAQRKYVAFVLLGLITVAGSVDNRKLQLAATVAMLALILNVLFTIDSRVAGASASVWYPSFSEASPAIRSDIERRLREGRTVRMRWIGVTLEAVWPFTQNLILDGLNGKGSAGGTLSVELAMLDPEGDVCRVPDGPVPDQLRATVVRMARFLDSQAPRMASHGRSLSAYLYDHRPTWHALLLDDDCLYFSPCLPQNLSFSAPQSGVEVISSTAGEASAERVRHFAAWFERIRTESDSAAKTLPSPRAVA
ncbi:hypothetical protein [Actinoplanes sp. NBRC 103695]|uniref:hypothetical protein n=1 Tax=Actinoplanes sp. NBRC 103695 TaxID=3032202 RepID=UPI0024A3A026|nr:hypothetical protein [Actinoplanes sp. NBRC 103695]GLY99457.1 hypothetical protein Acsp02_67100 [Actinoplanes sp. NBRC 103695]